MECASALEIKPCGRPRCGGSQNRQKSGVFLRYNIGMSESRKIRLLIIEDNVADVLLMREALRELCSLPVEITSVPDGEQALAVLKEGTEFDVVILDLALPKMDGHTFLARY